MNCTMVGLLFSVLAQCDLGVGQREGSLGVPTMWITSWSLRLPLEVGKSCSELYEERVPHRLSHSLRHVAESHCQDRGQTTWHRAGITSTGVVEVEW